MNEPIIYDLKEAHRFLKISRSTLYRRIRDNEIPSFTVGSGRKRLFYLSDLLKSLRPADDLQTAS